MKETKFEECYIVSENKMLSVEELLEVSKSNKAYYTTIKDSLACPKCRAASLTFRSNANTPHLSTKKHDIHAKNCYYTFEPATKKQLQKYRNNSKNREAIARKLNSCLDSLITKSHSNVIKNTGQTTVKETKESYLINLEKISKAIPRKRITAKFYDEDYEIPKLFYGRVMAKWDMKNDRPRLELYCMQNKYICSVWMSKNVCDCMENYLKFQSKKECTVAFFSEMKLSNNFKNATIKHSTELIIRIESEEEN